METLTSRPAGDDEQLVELTRDVSPELGCDEELELGECSYCGSEVDSDGACPFCGATVFGSGRADPL